MNLTTRLLLLLALSAFVPACGSSGSSGGGATTSSAGNNPAAGTTERVSVSLPIPGNRSADRPSITPDGNFVVFSSYASNLVLNDTNNRTDIFVKDLTTGVIERVSVGSSGVQADSDCNNPSISDDGRYVVWESYSSNLVGGDTNNAYDVFLRDRTTGTTTRVSLDSAGNEANSYSYYPHISGDGTVVVFTSQATNLHPLDTNAFYEDVFRKNLLTGSTELVSLNTLGTGTPNAGSFQPCTDFTGRHVAWVSYKADNLAGTLVATPLPGAVPSYQYHVYFRDMLTLSTQMITVDPVGAVGNSDSYGYPSMSATGRYVAFTSYSSNLVAGDSNLNQDAFVRDTDPLTLPANATVRVSVDAAGNQVLGYTDGNVRISSSGRYVVFSGPDFAVSDTTFFYDVYVRDRNVDNDLIFDESSPDSTTVRVSITSTATEPNGDSFTASISADGSKIVFASYAIDMIDGDDNTTVDVFLRSYGANFTAGATEGISFLPGESNDHSFAASVSDDGNFVAFESLATNVATGVGTTTTSNIFRRDRASRSTTLASTPAPALSGPKFNPSLSSNGRWVAFDSSWSGLVGGDTNLASDVFVRDMNSATVVRVSVKHSTKAQATGSSYGSAISSHPTDPTLDGRWVAFASGATNLLAAVTSGLQIFVHDRNFDGDGTFDEAADNLTELVSANTGATYANGASYSPSISSDGRYVAFSSVATDLVLNDTNGVSDIFLRDRQLGITTRISVDSSGAESNGGSYRPVISGDGQTIAFLSGASNLVSGDGNGVADVFVHSVASGVTTRVSVSSSGAEANGPSANPSISKDGVMVAFDSAASNLGGAEALNFSDVYIRDLSAGTTVRASVSTSDGEANGDSVGPALSGDGTYVAFYTNASNILGADSNGRFDVVIRGLLR